MSNGKAGGWLDAAFGLFLGGVFYAVIVAAAYKENPSFTLWPLDQHDNQITSAEHGNYTGYHASKYQDGPEGWTIQKDIDAF